MEAAYLCSSVSGGEQRTSLEHLLPPSWPVVPPMLPSTHSKITFALGLSESRSLKGTQKHRVKYIALVQEEREVFLGSRRQRGEREREGEAKEGALVGHAERKCICVRGHPTLPDPQHSTNFLTPRSVVPYRLQPGGGSLICSLLRGWCQYLEAHSSFGPPLPHRAQRV